MDTFNGVSINIVSPDVSDDTETLNSIRTMPGAAGTTPSTTVIDMAGVQAGRITLNLFFTAGPDFQGFKAQVGVKGLLVCQEYPAPGVLVTMLNLKRTKRNLGTTNETWASADCVLS